MVDTLAADYQDWHELAQDSGVKFQIVASAEEALRLARTAAVDLWVVNTELPGLSGYELCGMLKSRSKASSVFMVAHEYSAVAEKRAWAARATLFGIKGAHTSWLADWLHTRYAERA